MLFSGIVDRAEHGKQWWTGLELLTGLGELSWALLGGARGWGVVVRVAELFDFFPTYHNS